MFLLTVSMPEIGQLIPILYNIIIYIHIVNLYLNARSGQLKSSTSDGFLNRVAPAPAYHNNQGINQEMEDLSRAV